MLYHVYIIYSAKLDRYYVGYSDNLDERIVQHNSGMSVYTSKASDWVLKHREPYETREQAHKRELAITKKKSRKYIEWLISGSAG